MKRVTFDIQVLAESSTDKTTATVNGYEVFKGLAAHRPHNRKYGWTVSHINSGYAVAMRTASNATLAQVKSWVEQTQQDAPIDWTFEGRWMPSEALALSTKWVSIYGALAGNY